MAAPPWGRAILARGSETFLLVVMEVRIEHPHKGSNHGAPDKGPMSMCALVLSAVESGCARTAFLWAIT